jgi:hypothetical protein
MLLRVCDYAVERRPWEAFGRVPHDAAERFGGTAFPRASAVESRRNAMAV